MGDSPLGNIELAATSFYVSDLQAALPWYEEKLGLQPITVGKDGHGYASFIMGAAIVVLEPLDAALEPPEPRGECTTVNLVVNRDPAQVRSELLERDVECGPLVESPNFLSFLVRDLDGNRFYVTRAVSDAARDAVAELS